MRKLSQTILTLTLLGLCTLSFAQPRYRVFDFMDPKLKSLSIYGTVGLANYFGELCPTGECYTKSKFNIGFGSERRFNDYLSASINAQFYRIEGSDAATGGNGKRNLSFRANNFEITAIGSFEFLNYNSFRYLSRAEFPISMSVFLGGGITTNNPTALYKGEYVALRPLQTEGKSYSAIVPVIPFGLTIGYRINNQFNVSLNAGYRKVFSDYLDDVSGSYQDPASITDPTTRALAYRGIVRTEENAYEGMEGPVNDPTYPYYGPGSNRGNSGTKDGYLLISIKAEYFLPVSPFLFRKGGQKIRKSKSTLSVPTRGTQSPSPGK